MKNIERIIRYAECDLSDQERMHFEVDLTKDPLLKQEYDAYLRNREVLSLPVAPADEGTVYFATTVVRIREKSTDKKTVFSTRPVFASLSSAALVVSLILLISGIQNPTVQSGLLTEDEKRELESILAGDENEVSQLNKNLLPSLADEISNIDEDGYSALETELASSIAPTEDDRIAVLNELASSDDLLASLSDEEVDELLLALTSENE